MVPANANFGGGRVLIRDLLNPGLVIPENKRTFDAAECRDLSQDSVDGFVLGQIPNHPTDSDSLHGVENPVEAISHLPHIPKRTGAEIIELLEILIEPGVPNNIRRSLERRAGGVRPPWGVCGQPLGRSGEQRYSGGGTVRVWEQSRDWDSAWVQNHVYLMAVNERL